MFLTQKSNFQIYLKLVVLERRNNYLIYIMLNFFKFPFFRQHDSADCGPACLKMVAKYHGNDIPIGYLRDLTFKNKEGVSLLNLSHASSQLGFESKAVKINLEQLPFCNLPIILYWSQNHYVVLYKVYKSKLGKEKYLIADPSRQLIKIDKETFINNWISKNENEEDLTKHGFALLLNPKKEFIDFEKVTERREKYLLKYIFKYKKLFLQLFIGMLISSVITLAFPYTTQLIVDKSINGKSYSLLFLIFLSQIALFFGETLIGILRSWLFVHISARISLDILSEFLTKLFKLPIKFFDNKSVGDIAQRINDHIRIENFLTNELIYTLFAIINIFVYLFVLVQYNIYIFLVFTALSLLSIFWVIAFSKKRKELDFQVFAINKQNQDKLFEMVLGMQEIKLYGNEDIKREDWEELQIKYFNIQKKNLTLNQFQHTGATFLNHFKNVLISYISAKATIDGVMTIGEMLSVQFIIGQTSGPIDNLLNFFNSAQDAKISFNRLKEIQNIENEKNNGIVYEEPQYSDIRLNNVSFQFDGPFSPMVLKEIDLTIEKGKITAIVGKSGSGKSTLMKLLLNIYQPTTGKITIENTDLSEISPDWWRSQCGTVMQEGYFFSDTIENNITFRKKEEEKLNNALYVANLQDEIQRMPLQLNTKIGVDGVGLSGGQKQRISIARAIYKDSNYLFFDEATSNLDSKNEKTIIERLDSYFNGKTVLIIAHRLSTVKHADKIVVLEDGVIKEQGKHQELIDRKGVYFDLIRNQLELDDI